MRRRLAQRHSLAAPCGLQGTVERNEALSDYGAHGSGSVGADRQLVGIRAEPIRCGFGIEVIRQVELLP
ncbi:hypothetical protein D3C85_1814010 [compost metagenome]